MRRGTHGKENKQSDPNATIQPKAIDIEIHPLAPAHHNKKEASTHMHRRNLKQSRAAENTTLVLACGNSSIRLQRTALCQAGPVGYTATHSGCGTQPARQRPSATTPLIPIQQHCVASSAARVVVDAGRRVAKPFGLTCRFSHGEPDHGGG